MTRIIYTPSGRAGEYQDKGYAANLFVGCEHGCRYCYAPGVRRMDRHDFHAMMKAAPDLYWRLTKDCQEHHPDPIFLCFMCDLYPPNEVIRSITRDCLKIITGSGNAVNILTKGGSRAIHDFDLLAGDARNTVGATLTFVDDALSQEWEPRAAVFDDRLHMLAVAKDMGIKTWASIEPVIVPDESLDAIYYSAPYVDVFKVWKWNHDARAKEIDWREFYFNAKSMLDRLGKAHVFKHDLLKAAGELK